ncbi:uncharacterized protein LOC111380307 [Olea europaea var. sylvestris]|uniref:uncharacterized protein LOC111380307 n=1 Tax=Olea europaea var. sylvestris TaxID=158386 RepID=UPI000C1D06BD|nr:uncharacterized protein LOC111380307 [Olea europaea var. sylvestris]
MFFLCVLFEAREFVVGCENNLWAVPSSIDEFNKWAKKTHFQIGDFLVLKHNSKTHSVLEVNEEDYKILDIKYMILSLGTPICRLGMTAMCFCVLVHEMSLSMPGMGIGTTYVCQPGSRTHPSLARIQPDFQLSNIDKIALIKTVLFKDYARQRDASPEIVILKTLMYET